MRSQMLISMNFWNRKSDDPLLKIFLEKYGLHLLSIPREDSNVGDLYIQDPNIKYLSTAGSIRHFLVPKFEVSDLDITVDELMADVVGKVSKDVSGNAGLNFLENFLNNLAMSNIGAKITGSYEGTNKNAITFTFANPRRDSLDPLLLGNRIFKYKFDKSNALYSEDRKFFIVTAIAKSSSITVDFLGDKKNSLDLDIDVLKFADGKGGFKVESSKSGSFTFKGDKNLVFGVELYELVYDKLNKKIKMNMLGGAMSPRGAEQESPNVSKEDVFIEIRD